MIRRYRFPAVAFVVWRLAQLVTIQAFGGQSALRQISGIRPDSNPGFFMWDGAWYERIIRSGYLPIPGSKQQTSNFFPLLSWITRAVGLVVRSELAAAVIVTTVAAFAAVVLVYEVMRRWKDENVARWTIVLLLAFPTSLFFWQFYTEALFIALSAGAVLAMMQRRVWVAGLLGGLVAMSRPPGVLIFIVLVVMAFEQKRRVRDMLPLLLCPVGLGIVMVVLQLQAGDALSFAKGSEAWGRHLTLPWSPVNATLRAYLHGKGPGLEGWSWATLSTLGSPRDMIATYLFLGLFLVSLFRQWPWSARVFILTMVLIPITTGIVQSMSRYVLAAWPGFGVAVDVVPARARWPVLGGVTAAFIVLSIAILHDWSHGLFIA